MSKIVKGVGLAAAFFFAPILLAFAAPALLTAGVVSALNAFGISAFINGVAAQLAKRPHRPSTTVSYNGTVEPRRGILGEMLVSGMNVIPPVTSGSNNKFLHRVLAIAGHEVNAMPQVFFNQDQVGTIGSITGASTDGLVSTGDYANRAWIRRYMGTASQTVDFILDNALSIWTSSHRGRGVAYLAAQLQDDDKVYKTGAPEITVKVQGAKVYDPRLDSTNGGSGSHRYATPSTWAYSTNPALHLAWYLIDTSMGMGEDPATRIDWPMVITAADECDEMVVCPNGSGGSTTQKRYTCNFVFYATEGDQQIIGAIAGAMLGTCLDSGGRWRMMAGSWSSAAFTLGDSNIIDGGITLTTAYDYQDRYNGVRGTFIDPANNYQANEFPPVQNATYVTADGESLFKDVRFDACSNVYEAQRAAILLVRKSRNRQSATLACDMSAFKIRPGETGIVTVSELGWSNKTVRCEGWKFNPAGFIELAVREELSSDWNDPILADYIEPLAISNVTPVYYVPDAPSGLTATPSKDGIVLSWTPPAVMPAGAVYEVYEYTANTPFSSATVVWRGLATTCFLPTTSLATFYYWVAIRMPWEVGAVAGAHEPSGNGVAARIGVNLDFAYGTSGQCVAIGTGVKKEGGSAAWDSQIFSAQAYANGAFVSFRPASTSHDLMIGLNTDPGTDANYTSLDYAVQCAAAGNVLYAYESGTGISLGTYAALDDLAVSYDGAVVRYLKNGVVLREVMANPGQRFYLDSSFNSPGGTATNLRFGPYGTAAPVLFNARGNCVVSDTNAMKIGGSSSWDSDVYSIKGYTTCHVSFKANDTSHDLMVGLNSDPLTDLSYFSIDYGWDCTSAGNVAYILESGTNIGSFGTYSATTTFDITYDGTDVRYYKDGVLVRTVNDPGKTLYFDSSFYTPDAGINSLRFGPTVNLAVNDSPQLGLGAAAVTIEATDATHTSAVGNFGAEHVLTYTTTAQPVDHSITVTVSMDVWTTSPNDRYVELSVSRGAFFKISPDRKIVATATPGERIQIQITANVVKDTTYDVFVDILSFTGATGVVECRNTNLRVEHIKR